MLCKRVVTKDRRYITQITCYEKGSEGNGEKDKKALRLPVYAKQTNGGTLASLFNFARQGTLKGAVINDITYHFYTYWTPLYKNALQVYESGSQQFKFNTFGIQWHILTFNEHSKYSTCLNPIHLIPWLIES